MASSSNELSTKSVSAAPIAAGDSAVVDFDSLYQEERKQREEYLARIRHDLTQKLRATPVEELPFDDTLDVLKQRYEIFCDRPLKEFSTDNVKAYEAQDKRNPERSLYVTVCCPEHPYRMEVLDKLSNMNNAHIVKAVAHGIVKLSLYDEYRFVIIFERPKGKKLSAILADGGRFPCEALIKLVIKPLSSVLSEFEANKITHCRIHPDNIFISNKVVLGECVSEPAAISQEYIYEPPERISALPEGKGRGNIKVDSYALGVLAVEAMFGLETARAMDKEVFTKFVLENGGFHILTKDRNIPVAISDFVLGTLNPAVVDRWDSFHISQWLDGKRFNLIQMSMGKEALRAFEFNGSKYYSSRSLADAYFNSWEAAKNTIRDTSLSRWLEQSLHKKELATLHLKAIASTGGMEPSANKHNDELLARSISILDCFGPIRMKGVSYHTNGIGYMLCHSYFTDDSRKLTSLIKTLEYDLPNFRSELDELIGREEIEMLWKLEKVQKYIKHNAIGFGVERALYDLNKSLPCMSPLVKQYHITNNTDLLKTLEIIAVNKGSSDSLLDRHIAAFSASHALVKREVSFRDLKRYPHIAENKELMVINILGNAQNREKLSSLPALSRWCALRVLNNVEKINGMKLREVICNELLVAAEKGSINAVLNCIVLKKLLDNDAVGFNQAIKLYRLNSLKIQKLSNMDQLKERSKALGTNIAYLIAYGSFFVMLYSVISDYFF